MGGQKACQETTHFEPELFSSVVPNPSHHKSKTTICLALKRAQSRKGENSVKEEGGDGTLNSAHEKFCKKTGIVGPQPLILAFLDHFI